MHVNNFAIRNNKNSWALGSKSSSKTDMHHWVQQLIDQCSYNLRMKFVGEITNWCSDG